MSKLKLLFIQYASKDINDGIDFFGEAENHAHEMHAKMEFLLPSQIKKFMQDSAVQRVNEEGNIDTLCGIELLEVDTNEKNKWRSRKSLKIGEDCQNFISQLNLSPASLQLKWFFKAVENFHETVAVRYQKYIRLRILSK